MPIDFLVPGGRSDTTEALRENALRRLSFAVRPFRHRLRHVTVRLVEARRQGIGVFCLTVDREAPKYAGRIFGRAGFSVLERAEQLPVVVVEVLRH